MLSVPRDVMSILAAFAPAESAAAARTCLRAWRNLENYKPFWFAVRDGLRTREPGCAKWTGVLAEVELPLLKSPRPPWPWLSTYHPRCELKDFHHMRHFKVRNGTLAYSCGKAKCEIRTIVDGVEKTALIKGTLHDISPDGTRVSTFHAKHACVYTKEGTLVSKVAYWRENMGAHDAVFIGNDLVLVYTKAIVMPGKFEIRLQGENYPVHLQSTTNLVLFTSHHGGYADNRRFWIVNRAGEMCVIRPGFGPSDFVHMNDEEFKYRDGVDHEHSCDILTVNAATGKDRLQFVCGLPNLNRLCMLDNGDMLAFGYHGTFTVIKPDGTWHWGGCYSSDSGWCFKVDGRRFYFKHKSALWSIEV